MSDATVAALTYYPVKGLAGVSVDEIDVGPAGLRHDRCFMLVQPDGTFLSQRELPAMAAFRAAILADGSGLRFSAADGDELEVPVRFDGKRRDVSLFGQWFGQGVVQDPAADAWFSERLGRPVGLVRVTPEHERPGWGLYEGLTGFGDAHALMVTSLSSLDGLNARIVERGGDAIPMNRFRPNLVIQGWPEPHTEDKVLRAVVGEVEIGYSARSIRCAVPTVDQATGRKSGRAGSGWARPRREPPSPDGAHLEPTRTLASYRRQPDYGGGVSFGLKAAVLAGGTIRAGDAVVVREWLPEGPDPAPGRRSRAG